MHLSRDRSQIIRHLHRDEIVTLHLPAPMARLARTGLQWGDACHLQTPAFWAAQSWMWELEEPEHYRLGRTLEEELLACLLGGYGLPAEVGLAAYERVRREWLRAPDSLHEERNVIELLSEPLTIDTRKVRYRFARQKGRYLAQALRELPRIDRNLDDLSLRDALCAMKGIGPKTASWIVRNWRGSDEVAILDIHLLRAGRDLGLFAPELTVERDYPTIEKAFVDFAKDIGAKASILDSVIWMASRTASRLRRTQVRINRASTGRLGQAKFAFH